MKSSALLLAVICLSSSVHCVEFTVDQFAIDAPDNAPGDGLCHAALINPGSGGQCTVRAAIMETNANPGGDTILIPLRDPTGIPHLEVLGLPTSQPIILDLVGEDDMAAVGDLDIRDDLTISVTPPAIINGSSRLFDQVLPVIDASALGDRIFEVHDTVEGVRLHGLVLTGGNATGTGGGLYVDNGVEGVQIDAVDFVANSGGQVAAVYTRSPMRIQNSRFRDNIGTNNGAIVSASRTTLQIIQSSFYNNTVPGIGGVVQASSFIDPPARVRVLSTSIIDNDTNGVLVTGNSHAELQNVSLSENRIAVRMQPTATTSLPSLLMSHTVLANSTNPSGQNCVIPATVTAELLTIDDHNLVDNDIFCEVTAVGSTNITDVPAGLGEAGLDTQTWHWVASPAVGSPLIDAGSQTAVDFDMVGCVFLDQRQDLRPQYGVAGADESQPARCDIGAIEYVPERLLADGFETPSE